MKEQVHVIERLAKGTKCKDCVAFRECARDATLPAFETGQAALCKGFAPRKPQTNADRIRAMSDEELAEWFVRLYTICECCSARGECKEVQSDVVCGQGILDWLRQPVKDGEGNGN